MNVRRAVAAPLLAAALLVGACGGDGNEGEAAPQPPGSVDLEGVSLTLATMSDPYAGPLQELAEEWSAKTGADLKVDVLGYPQLATKVRSDFVGGTANYDLLTVDIVWSGEFATKGWTVDLTDRIERDAREIDRDDFLPVTWKLGEYEGQQIAFPLAGYANLLNYRTDVLEREDIPVPETVEDLVAAAKQVSASGGDVAGIVANGQQGPAVAQDWMAYNFQLGGSVLDESGRPALNSPENVRSLALYRDLFECCTPPGAVDFDWGQRETSFVQGKAAFVETWSVSRASYEDEASSAVAGKVGTMAAPPGEGREPNYAFGGWGLGINASSDQQDAAWEFIKWVTSKEVQKRWVRMGAGSYVRRSTLEDPELAREYPWQQDILTAFEKGDGDFRPRIPQYSEIEEAIGSAASAVLTQGKDPQQALDEAQEQAMKAFG